MSAEPSNGGGAMKSNGIFKVVDQVIIQIFKWICIVTFASIMVLVTANVLLRYIPITSINWYGEIRRAMLCMDDILWSSRSLDRQRPF